MRNILKLLAIAVIGLVVLTGCRTSIVQNAIKIPVAVSSEVTEEQMFTAIKRAGSSLGWIVKKEKPGVANAQLFLRAHMALVEIHYDNKDFSIIYVASQNLNYNATKNTIHSNYNGWISNLKNAIEIQMNLIK